MPPAAALVDYSSSIEEPFDGIADVGGIEVEAVEGGDDKSVVTRIMMMPRDHRSEEDSGLRQMKERILSPQKAEHLDENSSRYDYLNTNNTEKCLADSFDSLDEIEEDSHEAKLIRTLAEKANILSYNLHSGLGDATTEPEVNPQDRHFIEETEAKYLDVLDKHLEETDPESMSFSDLDDRPDDPHPKKNQANIDVIFEHFLEAPCCECTTGSSRSLKSALKPSKWTFLEGSSQASVNGDVPRSRSVQFNDVNIREFKMTLGNHPSATSGPPVMLDWETLPASNVMKLEDYERAREPRRNRRQLKLSLQQRHIILVKERGFSFEEVKGAWQEALAVRKQRKTTLERGLAMMKWDEVWESTCRKINRLVDVSA
jgi:hypothetical protein